MAGNRSLFIRSLSVLTACSVLLNGCADFPRTFKEAAVAHRGDGTSVPTRFDQGSDSELDIDTGFISEDLFLIKPMGESGQLPRKQIQNLTLTEAGIYDALRLMTSGTGLSLNIDGGVRGSERFGPVSIYGVNGDLRDVMDQLSESIGFFYTVKNKTLTIRQEQDFVIEIPPALNDDNAAGLTNTLQYLGAKDFYLDRLNRSLVFKTNRKSLAKIENYLKKVRDTRAMIIYDVNIFQVDLKDNSDVGIQWNKLGWSGPNGIGSTTSGATSTGVTSATTGTTGVTNAAAAVGTSVSAGLAGLGLGIVLSSSRFTIDSLINFLKTQGSVKAISRPRLAVISGTKGSLRIGQATTYVSKVGTNYSTSVNQVTTETKDLKTGLDLALYGDFSDNTIYTRIGLSISEIVQLNKFTALGTDLTLPQTVDRELNTVIRARPGDMILLGGITVDRDSFQASRGIAVNGNGKEVVRSELVLTLKTKIINFRGKDYQPPREASAAPIKPDPETQPTASPETADLQIGLRTSTMLANPPTQVIPDSDEVQLAKAKSRLLEAPTRSLTPALYLQKPPAGQSHVNDPQAVKTANNVDCSATPDLVDEPEMAIATASLDRMQLASLRLKPSTTLQRSAK